MYSWHVRPAPLPRRTRRSTGCCRIEPRSGRATPPLRGGGPARSLRRGVRCGRCREQAGARHVPSSRGGKILYRTVRAEAAAALRHSEHTIDRLLSQAHALTFSYPRTLDTLRNGAISERHTTVIVDAGPVIRGLDDPDTVLRRAACAPSLAAPPSSTRSSREIERARTAVAKPSTSSSGSTSTRTLDEIRAGLFADLLLTATPNDLTVTRQAAGTEAQKASCAEAQQTRCTESHRGAAHYPPAQRFQTPGDP